tara:strand:+ start:968 stop:1132 length:165 start_codon:yes stop_codon:yes gene_type:complete
MATYDDVKKTLLRVAGDPVSGPVKDLVDDWARAIVALDAEPAKETRVLKASEKR